MEGFYGLFSRTIQLPVEVAIDKIDKAEAQFKKVVLTLMFTKSANALAELKKYSDQGGVNLCVKRHSQRVTLVD